MKIVLFALACLASIPALAGHRSESCEPYSIQQGGEGGDFITVYPCGQGAPIKHRACREGVTELFLEQGSSSYNKWLWKTCRNGVFEKTKPVKVLPCRDGSRERFAETAENGENTVWVTRTCRSGAWH